MTANGNALQLGPKAEWYLLGGKTIKRWDGIIDKYVRTDRLGSVVHDSDPYGIPMRMTYFPYGEERSTTTGDRDKFGTYYRDAESGLDYADQRTYKTTSSRFSSSDPFQGSATMARPVSWNRYAYVSGDPTNFYDPKGLADCPADVGNSTNVCDTIDSVDPSLAAYESYLAYYRSLGNSASGSGYSGSIPFRVVTSSARAARQTVRDGDVNDCNAMTNFGFEAAYFYQAQSPIIGSSAATYRFVSDFGTFVDSRDAGVIRANSILRPLGLELFSTTAPIYLQETGNGMGSGYQAQFRDNDANADQGHHFAAYFILGYQLAAIPGFGTQAALTAGLLRDLANPGDQALAAAAILVGTRLRNGQISLTEVANEIWGLCAR